ncbi:hypothetical protein [Frateuria soli]|uniref:hypothetical protein n=1 Tax=Frateuria soli TaxID=1542730 RepID=UPI001E54F824|nr:hypothetical protein [Frateuria soli]UGB37169.1 hypothetical protein LQ771_10010 [Frateuria soli]
METPRLSEDRRFPWRWLVALVPLVMLVHEAHEFAHTLTGRLACGRWAERDFNRWSIGACDSWLPIAGGPLFSYLLMAAGALLAMRAGRTGRWLAVGLIFAANPLARAVTAASGHGDEMLVARNWAGAGVDPALLHAATAGLVLVLCAGALAVAWRALGGLARRPAVFAAGLVAGIAITGPVLPMLNRLLEAGNLAMSMAGAPLLVHLFTLASAVGVLASLPWLAHPLPDGKGPEPLRAGGRTTVR